LSAATANPALDRPILLARDKRERRGAYRDGRLLITDLTAEEALALDGLLFTSRRSPVLPGTSLRVALSQFEAALMSCGIDPRAEYELAEEMVIDDLLADLRNAAR